MVTPIILFFSEMRYPNERTYERWTLMSKPGRWLLLRRPQGKHMTRAARRVKARNNNKHFYFDCCANCGNHGDTIYCVKWSQDESFYCCPRDYKNDSASGWQKSFEAINLFADSFFVDN